jgi:hypothetical protein
VTGTWLSLEAEAQILHHHPLHDPVEDR